ncbi:MAG: ribosomal protection-like ABC-F family protein [Thermotogota bacterium]
MQEILINNVDFYYTSPYKEIFNKLNININKNWKTGIIGKNGRGKTTLLKLLLNELEPSKGNIVNNSNLIYFPFKTLKIENAFEYIKQNIAPYKKWENKIEKYLQNPTEENLIKYDKIIQKYQFYNGYTINGIIEKEIQEIGLDKNILKKSINTLSGGEMTKINIVILFQKKGKFPLIDEPTNHLDMEGREILASYLNKKEGFIMVSHDRYFLDLACDHIISLNKHTIDIKNTDFSGWEKAHEIKLNEENSKDYKIKKEIKSLKKQADQQSKWSNSREKDKKGSRGDKGNIGASAAKLMKKSILAKRNINNKISEKQKLLKDKEKEYKLKFRISEKAPSQILEIRNLDISYGEQKVLNNFSLDIKKGDKIAITGKNGSGKTSIIRAILNQIDYKGHIHYPSFLRINHLKQIPEWQNGLLKYRVTEKGYDYEEFRNLLGNLNIRDGILEKDISDYSEGEKKKVEIAKSLIEEYDLYIWDEPLNYIDMQTRKIIEEAILKYDPTILFIEHDRYFVENIATDIIKL